MGKKKKKKCKPKEEIIPGLSSLLERLDKSNISAEDNRSIREMIEVFQFVKRGGVENLTKEDLEMMILEES